MKKALVVIAIAFLYSSAQPSAQPWVQNSQPGIGQGFVPGYGQGARGSRP